MKYRLTWTWKVLFPLIFLHLLAIPFLTGRFLKSYEESLLNKEKVILHDQVQHLIEAIGLHQALSGEGREGVKKVLELFFKEKSLLRIAVANGKGQMVATQGKPISHMPQEERLAYLQDEHLSLRSRVENRLLCQGCHGSVKENPTIGWIEVHKDISPTLNLIHKTQKKLIYLAFGVSLMILTFLASFYYFILYRPLVTLRKALEAVSQGDLTFRLPVSRKDETGYLYELFNQLVASFQKTQETLEARHEEDMQTAEQLATVGELAAGLAHEVKNPLAGIQSALTIICSEIPADNPHKEILEEIHREIKRTLDILSRLLDYARPKPLRFGWISLKENCRDLHALLEPLCTRKGIVFTCHPPDEEVEVWADPDALKQVMVNLIHNAIQFTKKGGSIKLESKFKPPHVTLFLRDTGEGIQEKYLGKIFQPFFSTRPGGTGLGLAITRKLVETMGGKIEVHSQYMKGTTFTITLQARSMHL